MHSSQKACSCFSRSCTERPVCTGEREPDAEDSEEDVSFLSGITSYRFLSETRSCPCCKSGKALDTKTCWTWCAHAHQATRSKQLVHLFNRAGHVISYNNILQLDTGMVESLLNSVDPASGVILPVNLVEGRFMHFTADNIDILDSSLDGKNTFHATQVSA